LIFVKDEISTIKNRGATLIHSMTCAL